MNKTSSKIINVSKDNSFLKHNINILNQDYSEIIAKENQSPIWFCYLKKLSNLKIAFLKVEWIWDSCQVILCPIQHKKMVILCLDHMCLWTRGHYSVQRVDTNAQLCWEVSNS